MQSRTVTIDGRSFEVSFSHEHHNPPLAAPNPMTNGDAPSEHRVKQTTTCTVKFTPLENGTTGAIGIARCSVMDRYKFMRGNEEALDRAVEEAGGAGAFGGAWDVRATKQEFHRQVLGPMATEHAAYIEKLRDEGKLPKRRGPGRRALGRDLNEARRMVEHLARVLAFGVDATVRYEVEHRVRSAFNGFAGQQRVSHRRKAVQE